MKTPRFAGPALRVSSALILCAACFQAGRWYQELSGPSSAAVRRDAGNEMVSATHARGAAPGETPVEPRPLFAAGDPPGEGGDIITPLNVRDPSALVMGPGAEFNPAAAAPAPPPAPPAEIPGEPLPRARAKKQLESGRLLELLKRADKNADAPKRF